MSFIMSLATTEEHPLSAQCAKKVLKYSTKLVQVEKLLLWLPAHYIEAESSVNESRVNE